MSGINITRQFEVENVSFYIRAIGLYTPYYKMTDVKITDNVPAMTSSLSHVLDMNRYPEFTDIPYHTILEESCELLLGIDQYHLFATLDPQNTIISGQLFVERSLLGWTI